MQFLLHPFSVPPLGLIMLYNPSPNTHQTIPLPTKKVATMCLGSYIRILSKRTDTKLYLLRSTKMYIFLVSMNAVEYLSSMISLPIFFQEHGKYCGAMMSAGGQVLSVDCGQSGIYYVCDDVHHIRLINYYHPTPDKL